MTELEQALAQIEILERRIALLRQKLDYVIRQLYGSKSEKLDPGQLDSLENSTAWESPRPPTRTKRRRH